MWSLNYGLGRKSKRWDRYISIFSFCIIWNAGFICNICRINSTNASTDMVSVSNDRQRHARLQPCLYTMIQRSIDRIFWDTDLELHFSLRSSHRLWYHGHKFLSHFPNFIVYVFFVQYWDKGPTVRTKPGWKLPCSFNQDRSKAFHRWDNPTVDHDWTVFFPVCSNVMKIKAFWKQKSNWIVERVFFFTKSCFFTWISDFNSVEAASFSFIVLSTLIINSGFQHTLSVFHRRYQSICVYLQDHDKTSGNGNLSS